MILSKTVKVKWNEKNKKWYINKGYIFTKTNDEFEIKVEDLSKGNHTKIEVKCDNCSKILRPTWKDYNKCKNKDEKYYCHKCSVKLFGSKKANNTKLNKRISFAQWGIDNLGDGFLEKYWSDKNTINPWEIGYGSKKKVWIKCQEKNYHEDYQITCNSFVTGNRCPYCSHKKVHPKDSLGQYIIDNYGQDFLNNIWSDKNEKSAFEYSIGSQQKVLWKCLDNKHEDYKRGINASNSYEFRCPKCSIERNESILQEKVRKYLNLLNNKNYTILHENKCTIVPTNPRTNYQLPFDNEIKELKLIIEVMGEQHYKEISKWIDKWSKNKDMNKKEILHYQQLKDRYKRIKVIQQGYFYIEIPYWTDNKKEDWKTLISNKINEILSV